MNTHSSIVLLLALGVLSAGLSPTVRAAEVDTSQWKCERCPYPKAGGAQMQGAIEGGIGLVKGRTHAFGDYTGLDREKAHLLLGGELAYRGDGYFADATAADLGVDTRSLAVQSGREGLYSLGLGYGEIPRRYADGALTPFLGVGSGVLTLPAGFAAADTRAMPLGGTLAAAELGLKATRLDLGGTWVGQERWTYRVNVRRDTRDGTRPTSGSFFSTASQLPAVVDQATDQIEVGASYVAPQLNFSLTYLLSKFGNADEALTWDNPFLPVVPGATRGQLALAPDNQFQQVLASAAYQFSPTLRASADAGIGQGTQNATYLPSTLNASLAGTVPALPASSLDGKVNTFNANLKVTATPITDLRLTGTYARDVRDNETPVRAYAQVATDMFLAAAARSNTPFGLTQDRFKLAADYRGPDSWRFAGGLDWDQRERTYAEVVTTRETTAWGRASVRPLSSLALSFNLAQAQRDASTYGIAYWFPANNPALRKLNLTERRRFSAGARADWAMTDAVSLSFGAELADDDYPDTVIGLNQARTEGLNAALAVAIGEETQLYAFAQSERARSRQTGSQIFAAPDWTGRTKDRFEVLGLGIKHAVIPDQLDIGADVSASRAWRHTSVQTAALEPEFPVAKTALDNARVYASYKLQANLWVNASWTYESLRATDWALDGIAPDTVFNLLAFGNAAPSYRVNVARLSVRYRF